MTRGRQISWVLFLLLWAMMLLGWGLDDLRGFLAHPARPAFLAAGLLSLVAMALLGLDFDPLREGARTLPRQKAPMLIGAFFWMAFSYFLAYADRRSLLALPDLDAFRYAGLLLALMGMGVRLSALRTLGRHFSGLLTVQPDHELAASGLYRHIRHPLYLGGLIAWTGACLVFRSWLFVTLLPLVAVPLRKRIAQEEGLLAEQFGAAYEAYRRRTWRLVPHLW